MAPSTLDAAIIQHIEDHDLGLRFRPNAAAVRDGLQLALDTTRAGDATVSEATFCTEEWQL
ncbi:hypothetical protein [Streptomyces sp. C]|uniref:hypothetical protein n=1 Tax=Streptomyces sp. C TaxID=253839 RepID=UPI0001B4DCB3|nr:hypothetical protein [Streptomyces sp. C]